MNPQPAASTPPVEPAAPIDRLFRNATLGLNRWWRWVLGVIAIVAIWIILGGIPVVVATEACESSAGTDALGFMCAAGALTGISEFVLLGLSFLVGLIGVWIVVKLIHKKRLTQVVTGRKSFDYSRVLYAMLVGLIILAVQVQVFYRLVSVEVTFQAPSLSVYLPFVLAQLVLTPIQTGFEEVFFRGYLLQGLILLTKNKIVLALVTAVAFTLPHLANPEPAAYGYLFYLLPLMASGIFFGVLTLLDGGIELAWGWHLINNLFLGIIANPEVSALATPSLFVLHL